MKKLDLKNKSHKELASLLSEKKAKLAAFRFAVAGSNTRNSKEGLVLRKDIARILTIMNQAPNTVQK